MSFKVGDKVVCINDSSENKGYYLSQGVVYPKKDEIYTIRGFHSKVEGCVYLNEINNSHLSHRTSTKEEPAFDVFRFRKLDYNFVEDVISKIKQQPVTI